MNGPEDYDCDDDFCDEYEPDEVEEALANCCGNVGSDGVFWCGAAGSEDCDWECPFSRDIGLTEKQIDERDAMEEERATREYISAVDKACDPWFEAPSNGDASPGR